MELADTILRNNCEKLGKKNLKFSDLANKAIATYSWPGNVRELENSIERAVVLTESEEIDAELSVSVVTRNHCGKRMSRNNPSINRGFVFGRLLSSFCPRSSRVS